MKLQRGTHDTNIRQDDVFDQISSISVFNYISFRNQRIPRKLIMRLLPELRIIESFCSTEGLQQWRSNLDIHHRSLRRGLRMGLMPTSKRMGLNFLQFSSLADFVLQMHCGELAAVLKALLVFADRVATRAARKPDAPFWRISGPILITRDYWIAFLSSVLQLIRMLGQAGGRHDFEECPDYPPLRNAAALLAERALNSLEMLH